jgi:3-deoxy-7-phosphoheptulonate synthase
MIIVLKPDCTEPQLKHILEKIAEMGFRHELSRGVKRTLVGVIGEEDRLRNAPLRAIPGVEDVMSVLKPFKLASREFQEEPSVFDLGHGVSVGGGNLILIAGPCDRRRRGSVRDRPRREGSRQRLAARSNRGPVPTASRGWERRD